MATTELIEINPEIMLGKPVIRGTWITVEFVLRKISEGATQDGSPGCLPHLTPEQIKAALAYAADTLAHDRA